MKKFKIEIILMGVLAMIFASCSDFFEPNNDTTLNGDRYIKEGSELYSGFLGIITKIQAIGDKAIYLTDMRGELLEPTENTPADLYSIYNYDDDLSGNTYADPAKYYDVIIACNDYLQKAKEYRDTHVTTVDDDDYRGLISSTVRLKTWTYLMLAKIYGQAIWFDDPMQSMKDIVSQTPKNLSELVDECDKLLNTGFDGINGTYNMSWNEWLDPANGATSTNDEYKRWNMMVPGYFVLQAEIALWKGDYQKAATTILGEMSRTFALAEYQGNVANIKYMRSGSYGSNYGQQYDSEMPVLTAAESVIMYDYKYNQQNSLLNHFDRSGSYMMRASVPGSKRFEDITFNPSADATAIKTSDARFRAIQEIEKDVEYAIRKYRGFRKIYDIPHRNGFHASAGRSRAEVSHHPAHHSRSTVVAEQDPHPAAVGAHHRRSRDRPPRLQPRPARQQHQPFGHGGAALHHVPGGIGNRYGRFQTQQPAQPDFRSLYLLRADGARYRRGILPARLFVAHFGTAGQHVRFAHADRLPHYQQAGNQQEQCGLHHRGRNDDYRYARAVGADDRRRALDG